jgi:ribosomal protein S18 acetylase RimI-like enzyme
MATSSRPARREWFTTSSLAAARRHPLVRSGRSGDIRWSDRTVGRQTPDVPTINLRPVTLEQLDELCALTNRVELFEGIPRVLTVDELRQDLEAPHVDVSVDARAAYVDDELAGWAWIWNPPSEVSQERAYVFGEVDPAHRRRGVGRTLMAWGMTRAKERLRSRRHELPRYVRVDAYDFLEDHHRLYARMGFAPVRWFEELGRPLELLPDVAVPEGLELLPWSLDQNEEYRLVHNEAFADHWGSTPTGPEAWHDATVGHGARLDLSVVAVERTTGRTVAICLNHAYPEDDELTGRREAWIDSLATLREWRGRGVASALIAWSLAAFAADGFTHAMLGVDSDNPSGAARLYRSLGFERERRSITHEIEILPAGT